MGLKGYTTKFGSTSFNRAPEGFVAENLAIGFNVDDESWREARRGALPAGLAERVCLDGNLFSARPLGRG